MKQSRRFIVCKSIALTLVLVSASWAAQAPIRERISFNADWRFAKNDPNDAAGKLGYSTIRDWVTATGAEFTKDPNLAARKRPAGNIGADVVYTQPGFDDKGWRPLTLPHDWGIEGPFKQEYSGGTGKLPYWGVAWYRKHFTLPASEQGRQIYLDVDGAMSYANVWLNGQYVGGWPYGYASWRVDLTPHVKFGGENVIAIRLDNPNNSSRWYPGGGIYRNVWLVKTSSVHVGQYGTYLTTPEVAPASAAIDLKVTVANDSKADAAVSVRTQIFALDATGHKTGAAVASIAAAALKIPAGKTETAGTKTSIANPKLWSPVTPNRYVAVTTVEQNGRAVDIYETPFGIRKIQFDPVKGFLLNDQPLRLQGVCNHSDLGALGMAVNVRALERQLQILQEMGCNAIRTSHNFPAPELVDLCDKMGFVMIDEAFDCWLRGKTQNGYHQLFTDWSEKDVRSNIRRDRNHPCVIAWSTGNEVAELGPAGHPVSQRLTNIAHDEDPTRPVTVAAHSYDAGFNGFQNTIDLFGYNYLRPQATNTDMYKAFHEANPTKFVMSTESASTLSSRGYYVLPFTDNKNGGFDPNDQQMSSYDVYAPGWATPPDWEWKAQDSAGFVVGGEFVWTGFDYLGEPTVTGFGGRRGGGPRAVDTRRSSYFGIIDLAGFRKDRFYIYQSRWKPELPMAHILPHWTWPERVGQVIPVHVYTSGDDAELFLNGKSLGKKAKGQYEYRLRWDDVKYEPGELKVVAYKAGKQWATDTMKTAGAATKLLAQADRTTLAADGRDLSFVTVTIADKDGLLVPGSKNKVRFSLTGPGEIVATDNGDATSLESFQSRERAAFSGLCLAIVRTQPGQAGAITLKAESDGLADAAVTLQTK